MNPAVAQESPVEERTRKRILRFLGGYMLVFTGLVIAWAGAAGVTVSPTNFDSGPTSASLALLLVVIGILAVGALIIARYGSIYGSGNTTGAPGVLDGGWGLNRAAVFFGTLGGGLLLLGLLLPLSNLGMGSEPLYISPSVLFVPETVDGLAVGVLAIGISLLLAGRSRHRREFRAWWRRTGRYVCVAGVIIILIVAGLVLVPVRQSFSTQLSIRGGNGGALAVEALPSGTSISGTWAASPAGMVDFTIQGGSGADLYSSNASSGTFSLSSYSVPQTWYIFLGRAAAPETVSIHGTYFESTWPWPPGEPGEPTSVLP